MSPTVARHVPLSHAKRASRKTKHLVLVLFSPPHAFRRSLQVRDTFCVFETKRLMSIFNHDPTNSKYVPEYLRQKAASPNLSVVYDSKCITPGAIRSPPLAFFFVVRERRHVMNTTATLASRGMLKDRFDLASIHRLSNSLGCCSCNPLNETPRVDTVLGVQRVQNNRHNKNTARAATVPWSQ